MAPLQGTWGSKSVHFWTELTYFMTQVAYTVGESQEDA